MFAAIFVYSMLRLAAAVDASAYLSTFRHDMDVMTDDFSHHPCLRQCAESEPMTCDYDMMVSWYLSMSRLCRDCPQNPEHCFAPGCVAASGGQRGIIVINRQMPGPAISICKGDRIRVHVRNMMTNGEGIVIHWHGLHMRETPWMDGASMVTQCPIMPGQNFTYDFTPEITGTYFYHSHSGIQQADGFSGRLIIRDGDDPHKSLYDRDFFPPIFVQDWHPTLSASDQYAARHFGSGDGVKHILINGICPTESLSDGSTLPPRKIMLSHRYRYRLRIISGATTGGALKVEITGHNLIVIASDGAPFEPVVSQSFDMLPAERYDVIPFFTGQNVSNTATYELRITQGRRISYALIVYKYGINPRPCDAATAIGRPGEKVVIADAVNYNDWAAYTEADRDIAKRITHLRSLKDQPEIAGKPDVQLFLAFELSIVTNNKHLRPLTSFGIPNFREDNPSYFFAGKFNNISFLMAPAPILTQFHDVPEELFCNSNNRKCPNGEFCRCIHMEEFPLGSLVEIFLYDPSTGRDRFTAAHPIHVHGLQFAVVGMERVKSDLSEEDLRGMDSRGEIKRNFDHPALKDVVAIPQGGYAAIRFVADNPGIWLVHCHIGFHMADGMTMIFKVGDVSDFKPPPYDFPRCNSFPNPQPVVYCDDEPQGAEPVF